ncbi:unnamed protein product [Brachionus calyciflorus]|uniref:WD40 repeat-containing protein n=1 Tax=Brachionus calyciflorus TaxID=104777 RepID=A0A813VIJ2_9BILA|nr:unnamed protein product [Brachionus calyciflorus]
MKLLILISILCFTIYVEANDSDRYLIGDWSGHNSKINCFARLLNGNIISGSNDKTIRIWCQYGGSLIKIFPDQPGSVMSIAVSLNGDIVVSYCDGYRDASIQILNPNDGKILRKLLGHTHCVQTVIVLPENGYIVSGSYDGTIKIWNPINGDLIRTLNGKARVSSIIALSNGYIASGYIDGAIKIWNPNDGTLIRTLNGHSLSFVTNLLKLSNGNIVSASGDSLIEIWNPNDGTVIRRLFGNGFSTVCSVLELSNGYILSGSSDGKIRVWNPEDGKVIKTYSIDGCQSPLFKGINGSILGGSFSNRILVWNLTLGLSLLNTFSNNYNIVSFEKLWNGNIAGLSLDGTIKILNPIDGRKVAKDLQANSLLKSFALPYDASFSLIGGSEDGTITIWDLSIGNSIIKSFKAHDGPVLTLASLRNKQIASSSTNGIIKIWNSNDDSLVKTLIGHTDSVKSLISLFYGDLVSASMDKVVKYWSDWGLSWGDYDRNVWNLRANFRGHKDYIETAVESYDKNYIVSGSADGSIIAWNPKTDFTITLRGHTKGIRSLIALPNNLIASGSYDNSIKIWSLNGSLIKTLYGHTDYINDLTLLSNGNILSTSNDKTIKIWFLGLYDYKS